MKNKSLFGISLLALLLCFSFSCNSGGTSNVTITIDLGLQNKAAFNAPESSIIDRVLRFFAKDAEAAAPSNISSLTLNITGDGMDKITQNYPATQSIITIEVPAGNSRTFEILAYTPSVTFRGAATRNLTGGATVTIPITMSLYETKIVIPDGYGNNRVVQIDDMEGTNWQELNAAQISISYLYPYDIDFDLLGRIYIVNYYYDSPDIIRIDDITSTSYTPIASIGGAEGTAIAIDRMNNLIYYCSYSTLYRCNLDGTNTVNLTSTTSLSGLSLTYFKGLSVDNSGNLYIACNIGASSRIVKYNPATDGNSQYTTDLLNSYDVVVKNGYLYVADYDTSTPSDSSKIIQLTLDLNYINQLGSTDSGTFHGTHRFLAILNSRFYLIDEDENTSDVERIVAFDNFSSPIDEFYPSMIGQSPFEFFSSC